MVSGCLGRDIPFANATRHALPKASKSRRLGEPARLLTVKCIWSHRLVLQIDIGQTLPEIPVAHLGLQIFQIELR